MSKPRDENRCITDSKAAKVKVEGEHRRTAVFCNENLENFRLIRVDGCLVNTGLAADWIVSKTGFGDLIVELKGRDVGHALLQVAATVRDWSRHPKRTRNSGLAALIVCSAQKPQISAQRQRAERELRKHFGARLAVLSGNREHAFESFFG